MSSNQHPILEKNKIIKALIFAFLIGAIVLLTAVLPAEFNIDPIGTGKLFGFDKLYVDSSKTDQNSIQIKNQSKLTMDKAGSPPDVPKPEAILNPPNKAFDYIEKEVSIMVPAKKGIEYKVNISKYSNIKYQWSTDKDYVYVDFHGDMAGNNQFYESYLLGYSNNMVGSLMAPFNGRHGWYYRNDTEKDITVHLKIKGEFIPVSK